MHQHQYQQQICSPTYQWYDAGQPGGAPLLATSHSISELARSLLNAQHEAQNMCILDDIVGCIYIHIRSINVGRYQAEESTPVPVIGTMANPRGAPSSPSALLLVVWYLGL